MGVSRTSYEKDASAQIIIGSGYLTSCLVLTDGVNNGVCTIYNVSDVGDIDPTNKLFEWTALGAAYQGGRDWSKPVKFSEGLYVTISGTGATYIVEHTK